MLDVEFAELSDVGLSRPHNEDCCGHFVPVTPEAVRSRGWCFAIADGVGGQAAGEIASRTAIDAVLSGLPSVSSSEPHATALPRILRDANQRVFEAAADVLGQGYRSGGIATTIVVCAIRYDRATVAHVGDSRCYLIRNRQAQALTRDHTVANDQLRMGILSARQASAAGTDNLLTRALGSELFVNVDTSDHLLTAGDVLLLCSDGLHHSVEAAEMAAAVDSRTELANAAAQLVALANRRDGSDNVSIQLVRIRAVESVGMYRGRLYRLPGAK